MLFSACRTDDLDLAERAIELGANPRGKIPERLSRERERYTFMAARCGSSSVFDLLIDHGADIEAENQHAMRAIHFSIHNHPSMLRTILDLNAAPDSGNAQIDTPLCIAVLGALTEQAALLLERGADPNRPNASNTRPFKLACLLSIHPLPVERAPPGASTLAKRADMIELLARYGVDPEADPMSLDDMAIIRERNPRAAAAIEAAILARHSGAIAASTRPLRI
jgi:ankyrin repeat protein